MVADLGCLGCAYRSGKYSSPSTCDLVGQAACGAACYPSDRTPSHGQNTSCDSQQQEAGVTPEARRDRAAILRHDGVAPASDRVLAALCSLALSRAFAWSCCLLPLCRGEPGGETSSERHRPRTFPGSFHQSLRMTFEQGHLTVHGREDKSHRLGSAESLVLLADLVEAHIAGPPFLVEIVDAGAAKFGFCLSVGEVIDLTVPQKWARRGMTPFEELPNEGQATLTGLSLDESNELLAGEVARMRRDNVEETRLVLSVAERT